MAGKDKLEEDRMIQAKIIALLKYNAMDEKGKKELRKEYTDTPEDASLEERMHSVFFNMAADEYRMFPDFFEDLPIKAASMTALE